MKKDEVIRYNKLVKVYGIQQTKSKLYYQSVIERPIKEKEVNKVIRDEKKKEAKARNKRLHKEARQLFYIIGERDGYNCQHCGISSKLVVDHKRPIFKGGNNDLNNLQLLCSQCNLRKGIQIEE